MLKGDKDSSIVILPMKEYKINLQEMINEGIEKGKYEKTKDNTLSDLKSLQSFLYRNFKDCKNDHFKYETSDLLPSSSLISLRLQKHISLTVLKILQPETLNSDLSSALVELIIIKLHNIYPNISRH